MSDKLLETYKIIDKLRKIRKSESVEVSEKIREILELMSLLSELKSNLYRIKNIESLDIIRESNISYYRKLIEDEEYLRYEYRSLRRILLEKRNSMIRSMEIDNRYILKGVLSEARYNVSVGELYILSIIKEYVREYRNSLIFMQYVLDVRYKSNLIVDFYIYLDYFKEIKLIIEYDEGGHHKRGEGLERDKRKDEYSRSRGISMIRCKYKCKLGEYLRRLLKDIYEGKYIYYRDYER